MIAGISSYAFTWAIGVPGKEPEKPMSIYELLDMAIKLDVKVLQVADNLPLEKFSMEELTQIRQYADRAGLMIEVGARGMTPERLQQYIEIAAMMGSPILRFVIDQKGFVPSMDEIHSIIRDALPALKEKNIILAIENHDRLLTTDFVEMVEKSGGSQVGICLDTVNSMGAGEGLETVISRLAPLTVNLHVKEFSVERVYHMMGFVIEGKPLGKGMLPLAELIEKVSSTCHTAILEQWTPPESTIEETILKEKAWAVESIHYLKSLL
ncbi:MAG TPA: TIM barrel protein [Prolixibacteraceae bacterium]|nr:TIM barrel protein [Prolixibacteraceae bacterium]